MAKMKIKLVRSLIGRPLRQKNTVKALGLGKLNSVVEKEATVEVVGMINKVKHLLEIQEG